MGFGGINVHVTLEGVDEPVPGPQQVPGAPAQDAEVFPLSAADRSGLANRLGRGQRAR